MTIQDVVNLAIYGELSGVAAKKDNSVIVAFINMGLLELYKRFPIKVEEHLLELDSVTEFYVMPDNFMYPTAVYGEAAETASDQSVSVPMNDESDPYSVFFISWNKLQVPAAVTGSYLSILYVAKPVHVTVAQASDGTTEIDLPDTLLDALLSYVGYRGHLGVKSDSQSENNAHYARFERNCKKAVELGVAFPSDTMNMPERLNNRGFA